MGEFNLSDLEKIESSEEVMDLLIEKGIIKEKKFLKQLYYEKELNLLQKELVRLQTYVEESNQRILLIFEGRDASGKGGLIKRMREIVNPKKNPIVALSKPTEKEQGQWYFQRYFLHLPNQGEMAYFDRSWYNRAVVEPVFNFVSKDKYELFLKQVKEVENLLVEDGIILFKFFLNISKKEQKKRLDDRSKEFIKQWKLGELDKQAQEKWDEYTHYIEKMWKKTGTKENPWIVIDTDDKKTARLNVIKYLLTHIPGFTPEGNWQVDEDVIQLKK